MRTLLTIAIVTTLAGTAHAEVNVVATVPSLAAITKEIGGNKVKVTALSLPSQDPHFVDAKPSLVLKLNKAQLLVAVGLDLEVGWLPSLQTQARNAKIQAGGSGFLDCSTAVDVLDAGAADRSQGDVHPAGNPHYLYDPRQAAKCAKAIGDKLAAIDPDNAKYYKTQTAAFVKGLAAARARWEKKMKEHRGAAVITYHKSMTYLVDWLGLAVVATLEPKPGIAPTARHVAAVLKLAKQKEAKVVLQESYYPDKTGALCAKKLGGAVVKLRGGADVTKGQTYADHLDELVDELAEALR
jgi:zinc/manganese transport system substrate-binding protein